MIYTIVLFDNQNQATDTISIDCITDFSESYSQTATSHPVETGTPLTDNLTKSNDKFTISGVVSDFSVRDKSKKIKLTPDGDVILDSEDIRKNLIEFPEDDTVKTNKTYDIKKQIISLIEVGAVVGIVISEKFIPENEGYITTNKGVASASSIEILYPCICTSIDFSDSSGEYGVIRPKLQFEKIRIATTRTEKVDNVPAVLAKTPTGGAGSNVGDATGQNGDMASLSDVVPEATNLNNQLPVDPNDPNKLANIKANNAQTDRQVANTAALRNQSRAIQAESDAIKRGASAEERARLRQAVVAADKEVAKNPLRQQIPFL